MRRAITFGVGGSSVVGRCVGGRRASGGEHRQDHLHGARGTATGTVTISGCSGGINGPSTPVPTTTLATGGTIHFPSGTVTFGSPTLVAAKATHCPGYVKSTKKKPYTGAEPSLFKFSGSVTASTVSGLKAPGGKYKGEACSSASGAISAAKALKFD